MTAHDVITMGRVGVDIYPLQRNRSLVVELGVHLAVIKQGPDGVLARDHRSEVRVPPIPVTVVNGLGAGDGFGGALCHGLLTSWDLTTVTGFANAAGAFVAAQIACSDAEHC